MGGISKYFRSCAISALNLQANILKPIIQFSQEEKKTSLSVNLIKDAQKTVGHIAHEQGKTSVKHFDSLGATLSIISSIWISAFYMLNNHINKDIPEERKKMLNLNIIITAALALAVGGILNPVIRPFTKALQSKISGKEIVKKLTPEKVINLVEKIKKDEGLLQAAKIKMPDMADKSNQEIAEKYVPILVENMTKSGIKSIIDLFYITAAFRFFGPVFATPLAEMLNKFLTEHNLSKASNKIDNRSPRVNISSKEFFKLPNQGHVHKLI